MGWAGKYKVGWVGAWCGREVGGCGARIPLVELKNDNMTVSWFLFRY